MLYIYTNVFAHAVHTHTHSLHVACSIYNIYRVVHENSSSFVQLHMHTKFLPYFSYFVCVRGGGGGGGNSMITSARLHTYVNYYSIYEYNRNEEHILHI